MQLCNNLSMPDTDHQPAKKGNVVDVSVQMNEILSSDAHVRWHQPTYIPEKIKWSDQALWQPLQRHSGQEIVKTRLAQRVYR